MLIHVVNTNLDPICGERRPGNWRATALTLAAAEAMVRPGQDSVCSFCERAYLDDEPTP